MTHLPDFSERRIGGDTVFIGQILRMEKDCVRLPDGSEASREVVRHPGAAVILPLVDDHTVLLEWQYRYALGRHIWEIPAGKLDGGESPRVAAERELLEETGYRARRWDAMLKINTSPGFCDEWAHLFLARDLYYEGHPGEADEFVTIAHTPIAQAMQMIADGKINDAKTIMALFWWEQKRRQ